MTHVEYKHSNTNKRRLARKAWTVFAASFLAAAALVLAYVSRDIYFGQSALYPLAALFLGVVIVSSTVAIFLVVAEIHKITRKFYLNKTNMMKYKKEHSLAARENATDEKPPYSQPLF
jgi:hypothetical protein